MTPLGGFWSDSLAAIGDAFVYLWPFALLVFSCATLYSTWMFWRQSLYKYGGREMKSILMEIMIPREVKRSPQAMEQVLMALHAMRNSAKDLDEVFWDGEVPRWFSLEMVSFSGETHMYIRLYYKYRGLGEAAFFSHYPDVELVEVEDYADKFPKNAVELEGMGYDMWGGEMRLIREECFPIRSYKEFIDNPEEDQRIDPISAFFEVFGKLKPGQIMAVQILIQAADHQEWRKKWEPFVEKLKEPRFKPRPVQSGDHDMTKAFASLIPRSPGETNVLEKVDENLGKPPFDVIPRIIFFSPKSVFYESYARRGFLTMFNQYAAGDLNSFHHNYFVATRTRLFIKPYLFAATRGQWRKNRLLYTYPRRYQPSHHIMGRILTSYLLNWNFRSKSFKLNVESIATLFHPPMFTVLTAPHIRRIESRRTGPPAGLAIFGEEKEIEQFK